MPIINYPLDLTGIALTNHVVGEVHLIASSVDRFIVPIGGPFYTSTMVVRNNVTNAILQPGTQYKILNHVEDACQESGKNVCGIVYVSDQLIPSVTLEYQVVGGQYQNMAALIAEMLQTNPLDPNKPIDIGWGDIIGIPNRFPPTAHIHPANQFLGYTDLVLALENLRVAVANGDNYAIAAIYSYIDNVISSNSQYVTIEQLNTLLVTTEPFVKVYPTYESLKQVDDMVPNLSVAYMCLGRLTSTDRRGMLFRWDWASMLEPDEKYVLKPNHILISDPGRFVAFENSERVLCQHAMDVPVDKYGSLDPTRNLDTVSEPGKYWVTTQPNRPFDNGVLEVELIPNLLDAIPVNVIKQTMTSNKKVCMRLIGGASTYSGWIWLQNDDTMSTLTVTKDSDFNTITLHGKYRVIKPNGALIPNGNQVIHEISEGYLNVDSIKDNTVVVQTIYDIARHNEGSNSNGVGNGGLDNPFYYVDGVDLFIEMSNTYRRMGYLENGEWSWSKWKKQVSDNVVKQHALSDAISNILVGNSNTTLTIDANKVLIPGKYKLTPYTKNAPFIDGYIDVIVIESSELPHLVENTSAILDTIVRKPKYVIQLAYSETSSAFRTYKENIGWSKWNMTYVGLIGQYGHSNSSYNGHNFNDMNDFIVAGDYSYDDETDNAPSMFGGIVNVKVNALNRSLNDTFGYAGNVGRIYQSVHTNDNVAFLRNGIGKAWSKWRACSDGSLVGDAIFDGNVVMDVMVAYSRTDETNVVRTINVPAGATTITIMLNAPGGAGGGRSDDVDVEIIGAGGGAGGYGKITISAADLSESHLQVIIPPTNKKNLSEDRFPVENPNVLIDLISDNLTASGKTLCNITAIAGETGGYTSTYNGLGVHGENGDVDVFMNPENYAEVTADISARMLTAVKDDNGVIYTTGSDAGYNALSVNATSNNGFVNRSALYGDMEFIYHGYGGKGGVKHIKSSESIGTVPPTDGGLGIVVIVFN